MNTPKEQASLPCNRVFNIPELLAQIVFHLNNDDDSDKDGNGGEKAKSLRTLLNVCRLWHRYEQNTFHLSISNWQSCVIL